MVRMSLVSDISTSLDRIANALQRIVDYIDILRAEEQALKDAIIAGPSPQPTHPHESIHCRHCGANLYMGVDDRLEAPEFQHLECGFCGKFTTVQRSREDQS